MCLLSVAVLSLLLRRRSSVVGPLLHLCACLNVVVVVVFWSDLLSELLTMIRMSVVSTRVLEYCGLCCHLFCCVARMRVRVCVLEEWLPSSSVAGSFAYHLLAFLLLCLKQLEN